MNEDRSNTRRGWGLVIAFTLAAVLAAAAVLLVGQAAAAAADVVELLSGAKAEGKYISRDDKYVTFETAIGSRTFLRKYPLDRVKAVIIDGRREVINEAPAGTSTPGTKPPAGGSPVGGPPDGGGKRTRAQVEALIDQVGRTPPEWFDSVPLDYPKTLDLSWPEKPPGAWNNQRNVGQYVWDIINPNRGKWREGVRFMHHLLTLHEKDPRTRARVMNELGRMYYGLLQDYPRAAFWWRSVGVGKQGQFPYSALRLAECYWKMGNKQMALEFLDTVPLQFGTIKLLGDMGETRRALAIAEANVNGTAPDLAYLYAAEACQVAGQYRQALDYYQKLAALPATGQGAKRIERNQQVGRGAAEAIRLFQTLDLRRVPDGTYRASALGYEDQVRVEVAVQGGRITGVRVTAHREKQYYAAMIETPQKIVDKQGFQGVDATSGATLTSKAIVNAAAKALAGAAQ